jgi:hypothetical protein
MNKRTTIHVYRTPDASFLVRGTEHEADQEQVYCTTSINSGWVWMPAYDRLPRVVRERLAQSEFNVCAACLQCFVAPKIMRLHPDWPRERVLFAAIKVMEHHVRQGDLMKLRRGR